MAELVGLMRAFYAESGFTLDEERAAGGFEALLADERLGRVWLIEPSAHKGGGDGPSVGYVVATFAFAMEHGGMTATIDDFYVRPEARGEGRGRAALAAVCRACEEAGARALRVEVGTGNLAAQGVYRAAGFEPLVGRAVMALSLAPPLGER